MTSTKELHLSIVDQTTYRQYTRDLFVFPFPDISRAVDALQALNGGLFLALHKYPYMAGSLVTKQATNFLEVTYPEPLPPNIVNTMLYPSFAQAKNPKMEYRVMEKEGFPPAMLSPRVLCPPELQDHPGLSDGYAETGADPSRGFPIPVMRVQATFIPKGLILSVYMHHSIVDATALDMFIKAWSGYVKDFTKDLDLTAAAGMIKAVDSSAHRYAVDALEADATSAFVPHYAPLTVQPDKHPRPLIRTKAYETIAKILCFPVSALAELRAELDALTTIRITTFVALTSSIWVHAIRARGRSLRAADIEKIALGMAVNMRKRGGPACPEEYSGNLAVYATTMYPLSAILDMSKVDAKSLLPIAEALTSTISSSSPEWFAERIRYLDSFSDPSKTFENASFSNTAAMMITSWQHIFTDHVWGIPGTSADGKASAVRRPSYQSEGMRVLVRRSEKDADYEMLVCLEEGDMGRLIEGLEDMVGRVVEG